MEQEHGPLEPGQRFENFEIVRLLGRGGTAYVYEGYQEFLDRHVAIKVIPGKAKKAAEFRRRARAEATVLSRLRHPNVVRVFDAGVTADGALIYIVMEKLVGRALRDVLMALRALSVPEALVIGAQVCDAVEAAHRLGAIHRDLKPENIFIEDGNHARVLDFGVAKFLGGGFETTDKYRWQGTPLYMSPEHLQGRQVTVRSDIYALGTILYEALAGGHPCLNGIDTPTFQEIGWIQIGNVPPLLTELVPTIPDYVARVVQRAIAKAPENRYGSMHELGVALRDTERRFTLEAERRRFATALRDLVAETNASAAGAIAFPGADTVPSPSLPPSTTQEIVPPVVPSPPVEKRDTVRLFALPSPKDAQPTPVELSRERIPSAAAQPLDRGVGPARNPSDVPAAEPIAGTSSPKEHCGHSKLEALAARALATPRRAVAVACVLGVVIAVPVGAGVGLARRARAAHATDATAPAGRSAALPTSVQASSALSVPRASTTPSQPREVPAAVGSGVPAAAAASAPAPAALPRRKQEPARPTPGLAAAVAPPKPVAPAVPINDGDQAFAGVSGGSAPDQPTKPQAKPQPKPKALPSSGL